MILIGKSGSGKDTIQNALVEQEGFERIVTATTRPMRENEQNGIDYFFTSKDDFEKRIAEDDFVEYRSYNTLVNGKEDVWYYGSPKQTLDKNKDYVIILDVQGARDYVNYYGKENCCVIEIRANDKTREERAMKRGSFDKTEWDRRLADDEQKFDSSQTEGLVNYVIENEDNFSNRKYLAIAPVLDVYNEFVTENELTLDFYNCIRLLEKCADNELLMRDPDDRNKVIVYRSKGENNPEGWYRMGFFEAAQDLMCNVIAQRMLMNELHKKTGIEFEVEPTLSLEKATEITVSSNEIADSIIKMMNNSYEYYDNLFLQTGGDKEKETYILAEQSGVARGLSTVLYAVSDNETKNTYTLKEFYDVVSNATKNESCTEKVRHEAMMQTFDYVSERITVLYKQAERIKSLAEKGSSHKQKQSEKKKNYYER